MVKNGLSRSNLKKKILKVIQGSKLASLATISGGKPWVRYVVTRSEGLCLYICTFKDARKLKQIQKNRNIHLTIGGSMEHMDAPYVQIAAKAKVRSDTGIRKKLWLPFMGKYYTGVNDPKYVVLEVKPEFIEYMDSETHIAQIYKVAVRR
ncbi:MAG: hypothetical protein A2Y00_09495 [Omnitrophica WOR_2 bacterium GWF2_43_52]|nr:MAG: hypothetical protein A2Y00_09495 [Omnitrophica WOR_2 bacterium GWF2_43_52]HAH20284.1 hypothetical protein [Candidatus Omnitrophota bacterium]HBG64316.1 hypothetical protein [Candidatus Omnitrophota bacterium]HCD37535.1 hypothetical protein [Candidatus Omnitrophota bacterium]